MRQLQSTGVETTTGLGHQLIVVVSYPVAFAENDEVVAVEDFIDVGNILGKSWVSLLKILHNGQALLGSIGSPSLHNSPVQLETALNRVFLRCTVKMMDLLSSDTPQTSEYLQCHKQTTDSVDYAFLIF